MEVTATPTDTNNKNRARITIFVLNQLPAIFNNFLTNFNDTVLSTFTFLTQDKTNLRQTFKI
jgi:hypothetical protein